MKILSFSSAKMNLDLGIRKEELFNEFISSNQYILGNKTLEFENAYAKYNQTQFAVGVANGLDAIFISLKIAGISKSDEVIVPSNTYIATWLAITMCGATIVPVEPDENTFNISPRNISNAITNKTKAILPVHLYGQICDMESIQKIANENKLIIIEDNAQSQGSSQGNKLAGSFGWMNATSFYPTKNLGAYGDGGMITTNDEETVEKIKTFRNYGSRIKYYNEVTGINSRLDELQSYFLLEKLKWLDQWNEERRIIASKYDLLLKNIDAIKIPFIGNGIKSVYHQYVIRCKKRDELQIFLGDNGVHTQIHYPLPPHLQEAYRNLNFKKGDFPIAEKSSGEILSLPIYPGLKDEEINYVAEMIQKFYL